MVLTVAQLTLDVVAGVQGEVVAVAKLGVVLETGVQRTETPLLLNPVVEVQLALDGTLYLLSQVTACVVVVPAVLKTLGLLLIDIRP